MSPQQAHDAAKRQDAAFRAYVETGSVKGAAHRLGVTDRAIRKYLDGYCEAHGHRSWVHAVFQFGTAQREAEH